MPSFADELFADYGANVLGDYHADSTLVTYTPDGGSAQQTYVIIRDAKTKELVKLTGDRQLVTEVQLLVHRDPNSDWQGIANPELEATWEFFGYKWRQAKQDTEAIDAQSLTFTACTVRRVGLKSVGYPGRIMEATN